MVSSPQIKARTPPIRKPQPIHSDLFFLLAAFAIAFFWEDCTCMHCIANQTGFRGSVCGLAHHVGKEVTCFHFKRCASTRSKLHYCQPGWFQGFFVAWLIMLIRGGMFSLQELCFYWAQAALLPASLVSEVPCGLAHHAGKKVTCFHCKSCASIKPKLHYCQPDWFQRFLVAWLIMLTRSDLLRLQELCFH